MGFGPKLPDGYLPVFSVDTEEEAQALIVLACPRDGDGHHYARELAQEQTLENLQAFSDRLAKYYDLMQENRGRRESATTDAPQAQQRRSR